MKHPSLSRLLMLESRRIQPDGVGGHDETWVGLGEHWAEVLAGTGRDVPGEEITVSTVSYRITVRGASLGSTARPQPEQRFRDGTRYFRIIAVTERDRNGRYLTCFAREEEPS